MKFEISHPQSYTDVQIIVERAYAMAFERGETVFISFADLNSLDGAAAYFTPKEAQDFALSILAELNDQGYGLDAQE